VHPSLNRAGANRPAQLLPHTLCDVAQALFRPVGEQHFCLHIEPQLLVFAQRGELDIRRSAALQATHHRHPQAHESATSRLKIPRVMTIALHLAGACLPAAMTRPRHRGFPTVFAWRARLSLKPVRDLVVQHAVDQILQRLARHTFNGAYQTAKHFIPLVRVDIQRRYRYCAHGATPRRLVLALTYRSPNKG